MNHLIGQAGEEWESELCAGHRWGDARHGGRQVTELTHLRAMRALIPPGERPPSRLLGQILDMEICNWNLESGVQALCRAIGENVPVPYPVGHLASCSDERWRKIWAYQAALLQWLPRSVPGGVGALLNVCDPQRTVAEHVQGMLGERTPLKELYVERFSLTLECWLRGQDKEGMERTVSLRAGIEALEAEIHRLDPDPRLLQAMSLSAGLVPCHHKLFRRFAIILSSIGVGSWRGAMAEKGDGPAERAAEVERLLRPIDAWLNGDLEGHPSLGEPTHTKRFLAALLGSLLRAQVRE